MSWTHAVKTGARRGSVNSLVLLHARGRANSTYGLQALIAESGVQTGQALVRVAGSTAALSTLEFEPGLVNTT